MQSFDPKVQRGINRLQSFEQTARCVERLRRTGVGKLNFDLLYGLPLQTVDSCLDTVAKCIVISILDLGLELRVWGVVSRPVFGRRLVRNGFGLMWR